MKVWLVIVATVVSLLLVASAAGNGPAYLTSGKIALAQFQTRNPDGTYVSISVNVIDGSYKLGPGPPTQNYGATVLLEWGTTQQVTRTEYCTMALAGPAFKVGPQLADATLVAAGTCTDPATGVVSPLAVSLSWAATGDLVRNQPPHYLFKLPSGEVISDLEIGSSRDAQASGTIVFEGQNLTPQPSWHGFIAQERSNEIIAGH